MAKLKATELDKLEPRKKGYPDGDGLYFVKTQRGANWLFKFSLNGRAREMGLGAFPEVNLTQARAAAADARSLKARGIDPIDERNERRRRGITFEDAAREYWQVHCQHLAKPSDWINGMEAHVFPHIGRRGTHELLANDIIKFMKPIWDRELARKLRQWINRVVQFVSVDDPRVDRELMARVANRLGPQDIEYENHPAIPWQKAPELWANLPNTLVGLSMKLLLLTVQRVNVVTVATWEEFDFREKVWVIPAGRVKHWKFCYRVPLTSGMLDVLRVARRNWGDQEFVFPSNEAASGHLSNNAHRLWLHKHHYKDIDGRLASAHGLRTTFRNWSDDQHRVDFMLGEHVLQHMKGRGDKTERAYLRTDQLERRREVHEAWETFLTSLEREARRKRLRALDHKAALAQPAEKAGKSGVARTLEEVEDWLRPTDEDVQSALCEDDPVEKKRR